MIKVFSFFTALLLFMPAHSQDSSSVKYELGADSIVVISRCFSSCDTSVVFIRLHEDEVTGIEAAKDYLAENGGLLVDLNHNGYRLLDFEFRSYVYNVDPNRIFTSKGIKDNLAKKYASPVAKTVSSFAMAMLENYIINKKLIVALHNNTENKFSILSYKKGQPEAANAAKFHINPEMDPDDFILTTDTTIYRKIKDKNINVVMQSSRAKDDGSLSIYTQKNKIPYINIEAQHGHYYEQREMLYAIKDIIESYNELVELNYVEGNKSR